MHVEILTSTRAAGVERDAYGTTFTLIDGQPPIASRGVIWAAGMEPATIGLELPAAGVAVDPQGWIGVDSRFRTSHHDVYAAGSVVDGWMPASESEVAGRAAASAALDQEPDDAGWPVARTLHTVPEIASVGPTRAQLEREGTPYVRGSASAHDVLAAQIGGDLDSVLELYVSPRDRTLIAAHAFGARSIETIHFAQMAIGSDITVDALADFPFNRPSFGEAYAVAARRGRVPATGGRRLVGARRPPQPVRSPAMTTTRPRLLLVDDHAIVRCGVRRLLTDAGFDVVAEASSASEALTMARRETPDAIVLDIGLRDRSGLEILPQLRESGARVVILSMQDEPVYARRAFEQGAQGYVLKDAADEELADALRAVLADRLYVQPAMAARLVMGEPEDDLTQRERDVLRLIALGHTNQEIAKRLFLSVRTIEAHRRHILTKLRLNTRADLVRYALEHHLVELG